MRRLNGCVDLCDDRGMDPLKEAAKRIKARNAHAKLDYDAYMKARRENPHCSVWLPAEHRLCSHIGAGAYLGRGYCHIHLALSKRGRTYPIMPDDQSKQL